MMCTAYLISSGESETYEALIVPSFPIWWNQDFTQVTSRFDLKSKMISLSSKSHQMLSLQLLNGQSVHNEGNVKSNFVKS